MNFDKAFETIRTEISKKEYSRLKKHIIKKSETLMNLNHYMRETMGLDHIVRFRVLDIIELEDIDELNNRDLKAI